MSGNGWIKLHRKIVEWEWYDDSKTFKLFIHLLLTANHETKKWRGVTINPGQKVSSYAHLSEEIGIGVQSVRTSIKRLKSTGELTYQHTNNYGIFTLLNWEKYQIATRQPTVSQQSANSQLTTNKNDKNDKNKIIPDSPKGSSDFPKRKTMKYQEPVIHIDDNGEEVPQPPKQNLRSTAMAICSWYQREAEKKFGEGEYRGRGYFTVIQRLKKYPQKQIQDILKNFLLSSKAKDSPSLNAALSDDTVTKYLHKEL